jgi:hypothetical protein
MTAREYKKTLAALGLSQNAAAVLLGYSPRMSRRYAAGEWPVPPMLAALLRLMESRQVQADEVRTWNDDGAPQRSARRSADIWVDSSVENVHERNR